MSHKVEFDHISSDSDWNIMKEWCDEKIGVGHAWDYRMIHHANAVLGPIGETWVFISDEDAVLFSLKFK